MAKFLDYSGLQSYNFKIKEYIDKNGVPFKKLIGASVEEPLVVNFDDLEKNVLYWVDGKSVLFVAADGKYATFGEAPGWVLKDSDTSVEGAQVSANDGTFLSFWARRDDESEWYIHKTILTVPKREEYLRFLKADENVVEKVKVKSAGSSVESLVVNAADKSVTIDLSDYLKGIKIGTTPLTETGGVVTISRDNIVSLLGAATATLSGCMSATDKVKLDTLVALLGNENGDSDTVVNTIREVLAVFENYSEGANVAAILSGKVDKIDGKTLSSNDYTDAEKTKLAGIANGAAANVKSNWNATSGDAQILNKPTALKNPQSITINGIAYDGSAAKTVTIDKAFVGLGNVSNVDTTCASNISTGTLQTARLDTDVATTAITTAEIDALFA